MLLRASGEHDGKDLDLGAVVGDGDDDGGIPHGRLLARLAETALARDAGALDNVRAEVRETLGDAALVDAAAVIAAFEGLDRVADSTGIPIDPERIAPSADLRARLGIDAFPSRAAE